MFLLKHCYFNFYYDYDSFIVTSPAKMCPLCKCFWSLSLDKHNVSDSGIQCRHTDEEDDSLLCDAASNLTTIPPMLSSRYGH